MSEYVLVFFFFLLLFSLTVMKLLVSFSCWIYCKIKYQLHSNSFKSCKKGVSFKHEGELGEFEKVVQTLNTFMKYFFPIKCHKLIYLLIYVDFLNTCSGRWHFQLASHIADRTTHRPIKIHLTKNLKAKIRQPIGCDIAFRQIENMAQSLTYVFVKILL